MNSIIAILGDSPEQCVTRGLAACKCSQPEGHAALAPQLLTMVMPNLGDPELGQYVLVIEGDGTGFDAEAEGIRIYSQPGLVN